MVQVLLVEDDAAIRTALPAQRARRRRASGGSLGPKGAARRETRILVVVVGMTTLVVLSFAVPLAVLIHDNVYSRAP